MVESIPETPEEILDRLDEEQRQVALQLTGPVCVLAGAGTGKTRAITHRIAYGVRSGVYAPQRLLALTFTAKAAAEMRGRLRGLGVPMVQTRTFHAAALRQLQHFWPQVIGGVSPGLVEHKVRLIAEASKRLRLEIDRVMLRDLASEIEWAKVSMRTPESYLETERESIAGFDQRTVARLYQAYEDLKLDRRLIDFEDVLLLTVGILQEDPAIAATVREQYRHLVVDEYQDVSPLQHRLLQLWLGERKELCVVGDASQTIYSFTGASSRFLVDFPRQYPGAEVIKLIRDYRSTPQVVRTANSLLSNRPSGGKEADAAWVAPLRLESQREAGPEPVFQEYADDEAEAQAIAAKIQALLAEGIPATDIAVLFRTNGQSELYEQALSTIGIAYQLRGGQRFFTRKEVKEAMIRLRAASRAVGAEAQQELAAVGLVQQVTDVLQGFGYSTDAPDFGKEQSAARERWESLAALVALAEELATSRGADFGLAEFVHELEERAEMQQAPTSGVTLASLHSAKGLEWEAVFLVGLSEGLMPISFADTPVMVDEERRLLYVGITRAKTRLSLSWSLSRTVGGKATRDPSRFLRELRRQARRPLS